MHADIGLGIFVALAAVKLFGVELTSQLLAMAILFTLLPDADFIVHAIAHRKVEGKYAHTHRDLFHYPLPYLAVGSAIAAFFGPLWLFVFAMGSLAHFAHDSMGVGGGSNGFIRFLKNWSNYFRRRMANWR